MNRIAKRTSTCGGIALWALGCSSLPADATYPASASDAGAGGAASPMAMTDSAVSNPEPDVVAISPIPDVVDAFAGDEVDASAADVVDASVPDAETPCNQTGAAACDGALRAIAGKALARKTGARGLRSILEQVLLDVMYDLPSQTNLSRVVVDEATIANDGKPLLMFAESPKVAAAHS